MKEYSWGTAQLERWYAYDGSESEGVLYVPEDFDPNKKYPMLCVFYETGSEDLYRHYTMEPSWSWVNYPFYVSRGYVVFVPDIHYKLGPSRRGCLQLCMLRCRGDVPPLSLDRQGAHRYRRPELGRLPDIVPRDPHQHVRVS